MSVMLENMNEEIMQVHINVQAFENQPHGGSVNM